MQGGRLLLLVFLTRILGKDAFGTFALAQVCFGLATFFADAGLGNMLYQSDGISKEARATFFWLGLLSNIMLTLSLLLISRPMASFYRDPLLETTLLLTAPALFFSGLCTQPRILFRREMRFALLAKMDMTALVGQITVTLYLAYYGAGVLALAWGNMVFHGMSALMYWLFTNKKNRPSFTFSRAIMAESRSFGLFQIGERTLNYIAERADVLIIGKVLGPGLLGIYDVMKQILSRPEAFINPAVCQVALPRMLQVKDDASAIRHIYLENLFLILKLNLPIYIFLLLAAQPFLSCLLGSPWADHADVFRWLIAFYMIHSAFNPIGALQMAKGRADLGFYFNLLLFVLLPCAIYVGTFGGLAGVAMALFLLFLCLIPVYYQFFLLPMWK